MNSENINNIKEKWHAFLVVSRANLLVTSLGHATLGIILGASVISDLFNLDVLLYILLHYSIAFFACNVNSFFDYEVDKRYKTYMSDGVDLLSQKMMKLLIIAECMVALLFIGYFYVNHYWLISLLGLIGLGSAYVYSAEPFRVKRRGFFSPFPLFVLYSVPIAGGWFLFQSTVPPLILIFLIGYMFMNEGFTLVNVCEDYDEDEQEHIRTWAHLFGIKTTIRIAFIFSLLGVFCVLALGLKLLLVYEGSIHIPAIGFLVFSLVLILKASMEVIQILKGDDVKERSKLYGKRLMRWFLMTRYPLMITGILILL